MCRYRNHHQRRERERVLRAEPGEPEAARGDPEWTVLRAEQPERGLEYAEQERQGSDDQQQQHELRQQPPEILPHAGYWGYRERAERKRAEPAEWPAEAESPSANAER